MSPARFGILQACCHVGEPRLQAVPVETAPGGSPLRTVISANRLDTSYHTIAEAFREKGYRTAHLGKWHVGSGPYEATNQGFDVDIPHTPDAPGPGGGYLAPWRFIIDEDGYRGAAGEHIEDWLSGQAANLIEEWSEGDKPFYLQYWAFSVHSPTSAKKEYTDYFAAKVDPENTQQNPVYAAMVRSLDDAVGNILDAVEKAGISKNTIILFYSDNGGLTNLARNTDPPGYDGIQITNNHPWRGGKASIYEGGIRVPCIWSWPGKIRAGSESDAIMLGSDIYPTLAEICGLETSGITFDGQSQLEAIHGKQGSRDEFLCHFPALNFRPYSAVTGYTTALRKGDWKLIRYWWFEGAMAHKHVLYNLKEDPAEERDLSGLRTELLQEMVSRMDERLKFFGAVNPLPNPAYDPASQIWFSTGWWPEGKDVSVEAGSGGISVGVKAERGRITLHLFTKDDSGWPLSINAPAGEYEFSLEYQGPVIRDATLVTDKTASGYSAQPGTAEEGSLTLPVIASGIFSILYLELPRGEYIIRKAELLSGDKVIQAWI